MITTSYLNLKKPEYTDTADIDDINDNMDTIDGAYHTLDTDKADKDTDAVEGNFASFDSNGNVQDSGHKHSDYLTSHQDISGKADKVVGGTSDNFAGLDANGNLKDSGKNASDFTTPTDLANGLATKAPVIEETIDTPASVMTFDDGADSIPMSIEVAITPVQDLHGYDNPWPAGGGKNLINPEEIIQSANIESSGKIIQGQGNIQYKLAIMPVTNGSSYTMSGSTDITGGCVYAYYTTKPEANSVSYNNERTVQSNSRTFTAPIDGWVAVRFSQDDPTPQLELGSTATSYAPYSNICPITGWTGAKVTRTGKNLFGPNTNPTMNRIIKTGGVIGTADDWSISDYIPVFPNTQYTFNPNTTSGSTAKHAYYDSSKTFIDVISSGQQTFTTPSNCAYMRFSYRTTSYDIQLEFSLSASTYESFGQVYDITFPNPPATVYGGTLKVNKDGTGVLVVDRGIEVIDGVNNKLTLHKQGNTAYVFRKSKPSNSLEGGEICNKLNSGSESQDRVSNGKVSWYAGIRGSYIYVDTDLVTVTTQEQFDTWCQQENVVLVYNLATPVTYNLTASEVGQILSLYGVNNVWADTGDVNEVRYPVDTKLYIDGKIAELQALFLENT